MKKLNFWFLYKFPYRPKKIFQRGEFFQSVGSDTMRALQLPRLIRPFLRAEISLRSIPFKPNDRWGINDFVHRFRGNGIVLLSKNLAYKLSDSEIHKLRNTSIALGVDHVDANLSRFPFQAVDFHVSASLSGYRALRTVCADSRQHVGLLAHHSDPRIGSLQFSELSKLRTVYLGDPSNLYLPEALRSHLDVLCATTDREMRNALPALPKYNLHYAVRPENHSKELLRVHKPFTKGANAAACKANILVHEDTDDAKDLLGEDYPYFLKSYDGKNIEEALLYARESFGSSDWFLGLDRMENILRETSPRALAKQLESIVDAVA